MLTLSVLAQAVLPTPDDIGGFLSAVLGAATGKHWSFLAALGVMAFVFCLRKFGAKISPKLDTFLHSDPGGVLLALLAAFATALAAAPVLTGAMALAALKTALVAMGGFALVNKLLFPLCSWLYSLMYPTGAQQATAIADNASAQQAAANAQPTPSGSAVSNLNSIK